MSRARPIGADARRAELVTAARDVFARRGYHAAGVADIIEAAGVARGTFYNYFESKRAIFAAVLEEVLAAVTDAIHAIDVTSAIEPQVRDNIQRVVTALQEEGDVARMIFADAVGIDAEGVEALREFYGAALDRIERALRTGQALGVVRIGDVKLTARCLLGTLKEPVFQSLLWEEAIDPDALATQIIAILGGGVLVGR